MHTFNFTKKFLGLQGVEVKNFEIDEETLYLIAEMKRKPQQIQFTTTVHR